MSRTPAGRAWSARNERGSYFREADVEELEALRPMLQDKTVEEIEAFVSSSVHGASVDDPRALAEAIAAALAL
jgi:hypothetical protein